MSQNKQNAWFSWLFGRGRGPVSTSQSITMQYVGGRVPRAPEVVSPENALDNPTVFACVQILCQTIAQLQWGVCERNVVGFQEVEDHPINKLLTCPNPAMSEYELKHAIVSDLLIYGNSYLLKMTTESGKVFELVPLRPDQMTPILSATGKRSYRHENGTIYSDKQIIHIRDFIGNTIHGLSKVQQAATIVRVDNALENAILDNFSNGTAISGVVSFPESVPPDVKAAFAEAWANKFGGQGSSRGSIAVLDNGATFTQVESISPADADLLDLKKQTMSRIAAVFRVPSTYLEIHDQSKYNNLGQGQAGFYRDTISPIIQNISQKLTAALIDDPKLEIEFATTDLIKGDLQSATSIAVSAVSGGILTVNEARELLDFPETTELTQTPRATFNADPLKLLNDNKPANPTEDEQ